MSSPDVVLDWSIFGGSGNFMMRRGTIGDFYSYSNIFGPSSLKTCDDAVLEDTNSYWYDARNRSMTDTLYFYHADHLGMAIAMTDTSGSLVWRAEHVPFGSIYALSVSTISNNLRFPGQYYDSETGLAQNWFRDYDAKIGRYWEVDPKEMGKKYFYLYSDNNPIIFYDYAGEKTEYCCRGIRPLRIKIGRTVAHCFIVLNKHSYGFNEHGDNKVIKDNPADKDRRDCTTQDCIDEKKLQKLIDDDMTDSKRLEKYKMWGSGQYNCQDWAQDRLNQATDTKQCCKKSGKGGSLLQ